MWFKARSDIDQISLPSARPLSALLAFTAEQTKAALDLTHKLGGANFVLWGGRDGYQTLLNVDVKKELDHYGMFLR